MRPRPFGERAYLGRQAPRCKYTATFFTPRSPWEPRLYGRAFGVSNAKLQNVYRQLGVSLNSVKPIVLLSPHPVFWINM
jgi:hypothetical protein